ncbi:MAG: aminotransferase class V-fold PLP-dependent enzyme [Bacillota bacterium]
MSNALSDLFRRMRRHFPALDGELIFFDNAAGAQLPEAAIDQVARDLLQHNAQKGPVFSRQERMVQLIYDLRGAVADLVGSRPESVALGLNATSLTALVAHHLGRDLKAGDLILTTDLDHQANVSPWEEMADRGVRVEAVPITPAGRLDMEAYRSLLARGPRLVACGWVSNATGVVNDLPLMTRLAHEAGALMFVDCVAGAPHLPMHFDAWELDVAVASAYKLFGPHLGFVAINPARLGGWRLGELIGRPAGRFELGTAHAAKLELGTQNHEGVAGFHGTIAYLEMLGTAAAAARGQAAPSSRRERLLAAMEAIGAYERGLTEALREAVGSVPGAIIYGEPAVPILSFNLEGRDPAEVARHLDRHGIEARTGNYLAIRQMTKLAAPFGGEAVRVSLLHYNTPEEIERLGAALRSLVG